ncbi:MAG: hypothetical protein A2Y49_03015 [Candidatus Zambryskibacteria bacterium RIFCSPLOWO2_12_39_8]|uniref:histidine kinase n=1 Tax=Candidatus Zambryskibacteria bacterium RIFCSPLOWO2_12_39_8 TaxID=1802774 RepID=A0A1G2UX25_9BACT|nr:MAG: hypothetical protein A2Y49_03015 [Candidatus Zambryskibacteria bacterium RIFCSPLOWO2_12_39_8]
MTNEVVNLISACNWDSVRFLFISNNVFDPLIYYSHLFPLVASLILVTFLYFKSSKNLATKILLVTTILLDIWLFNDLIIWATDKPALTMYAWSILVLLEPMIYAGLLHFLYLFIDEKDISFTKKLIIFLLLTPTVIFASTKLAILGYDISNCDRDAVEGPMAYYGYFIEIIFILWILSFVIKSYVQRRDKNEKQKILLITLGSIGFLIAFSFGNVIGSLFNTNSVLGDYSWTIGQYGIFGVPVFLAFLAYIIVKYKTFNAKVFGAQVLIGALVVFIGSEFFFVRTVTNRILTGITFVLVMVFGYLLIKSVKKEIEQREKIEKLAGELKTANEGQVSLMHFMNHQIKGRFGNAKNIFAELMTGDYGVMPADTVPLLEKGLEETDTGINYVQGILKGASAESGTLPYDMKPLDMKLLVEDVVSKQKEHTDKKGLVLNLEITPGDYNIIGDTTQLGEAVRNLIDNSINYTEHGGITITLSCHDKNIKLTVKDTGIGIAPEDRDRLFKAGGRGVESLKININATGYGLVFVKGVVEANKGKVWVESPGRGRGSTFIIELPHLAISLQEQYTFSTF